MKLNGHHLATDMSNRVEHQKRKQLAIEKWPFVFNFDVQLGLRQTLPVIITKKFDQLGAGRAPTWLSFWCSTRLLMSVKKCFIYRGKTCKHISHLQGRAKKFKTHFKADEDLTGAIKLLLKFGLPPIKIKIQSQFCGRQAMTL